MEQDPLLLNGLIYEAREEFLENNDREFTVIMRQVYVIFAMRTVIFSKLSRRPMIYSVVPRLFFMHTTFPLWTTGIPRHAYIDRNFSRSVCTRILLLQQEWFTKYYVHSEFVKLCELTIFLYRIILLTIIFIIYPWS